MCGIAGWIDLRGQRPPDQKMVRTMTDAISHRGPDGDGFHFEPGLGFGHRRLAVIDLVTGDQPMHSGDGSATLIFNGEIYNFRELKQELEQRGHVFRTQSDTEVILEAWLEWGPGLCHQIDRDVRFRVVGQAQGKPVPGERPVGREAALLRGSTGSKPDPLFGNKRA